MMDTIRPLPVISTVQVVNAPDEIKEKSICINGDIGDILNKLK